MPSCHGVGGSPAEARLLRPWQPRHAAPCRGPLIYGDTAPRTQPAWRGPWWDSLSPRVASSERRMGTGWQASLNKCADTLRSGSTHKIDLLAPLPGLERGTCWRNLNSILAMLAVCNSVGIRPLPDPRRSCWSLKNLIFFSGYFIFRQPRSPKGPSCLQLHYKQVTNLHCQNLHHFRTMKFLRFIHSQQLSGYGLFHILSIKL